MAAEGRMSGEGEEERLPELLDRSLSALATGWVVFAGRSGRTVP